MIGEAHSLRLVIRLAAPLRHRTPASTTSAIARLRFSIFATTRRPTAADFAAARRRRKLFAVGSGCRQHCRLIYGLCGVEVRQRIERGRHVMQSSVRIASDRECRRRVSGKLLGHFHRSAARHDAAYERVARGVKIGHFPRGIAIPQKIGFAAHLSFFVVSRLCNPFGPALLSNRSAASARYSPAVSEITGHRAGLPFSQARS